MVEAEEDRAGERRRCSPLMAATHSLTPASTPPRLASRQDKRKHCTTRHKAPTSEQRRTPQGSGGQNDTDKQQRGRSALSQRDLLHTLHPAARHWCSTGAAPVLPTDSPTTPSSACGIRFAGRAKGGGWASKTAEWRTRRTEVAEGQRARRRAPETPRQTRTRRKGDERRRSGAEGGGGGGARRRK